MPIEMVGSKAMPRVPIWSVLWEAAEDLTRQGRVPFSRLDLLKQARIALPRLQRTTFDPTVQSMTQNAPASSPSRGTCLFQRVGRGLYILASNSADTVRSQTPAIPARPRRQRPPVELRQRVAELKASFGVYLDVYDQEVPFTRAGQLEFHRETILRRRKSGSASAAIRDADFITALRSTLDAWGIGRRSSRLVDRATFIRSLESLVDEIESLENVRLSSIDEPEVVIERLWRMIEYLGVVANKAKVVAGTKTLHHLLPDLVVPIDRAWTGAFVGWSPPYFQSHQRAIFFSANRIFVEIARAVQPGRYVGEGWRTSQSKLIDNAMIGYCKAHGIAPMTQSLKPARSSGGDLMPEFYDVDLIMASGEKEKARAVGNNAAWLCSCHEILLGPTQWAIGPCPTCGKRYEVVAESYRGSKVSHVREVKGPPIAATAGR